MDDDFEQFLNQLPSTNYSAPPPSNFASANELDDLLGEMENSFRSGPPPIVTPQPPRTAAPSLDDELDELMNLSEPDRKPPQVPIPNSPSTANKPEADLDDLMNQLGTRTQPSLTRQNSRNRMRNSMINQNNKLQNSSERAPTPTPTPTPVKVTPPAVSTPPPVDDLESLINQLPAPNKPSVQIKTAPVVTANLKNTITTTDLNNLMEELNTPSPNNSYNPPRGHAVQSKPQSYQPAPMTSDLDDLMNQLNIPSVSSSSTTTTTTTTTRSNVAPPSSSFQTNDLDDLLSEISATSSPPITNSRNMHTTTTTTTTSSSSAAQNYAKPPSTDLDDLDSLMGSLGISSTPSVASPKPQFQSTQVRTQTNVVARNTPQPQQQPINNNMSSNLELDDLLASLDSPQVKSSSSVTTTTTQTRQSYNPQTSPPMMNNKPALDDLDALVAELNTGNAPSYSPPIQNNVQSYQGQSSSSSSSSFGRGTSIQTANTTPYSPNMNRNSSPNSSMSNLNQPSFNSPRSASPGIGGMGRGMQPQGMAPQGMSPGIGGMGRGMGPQGMGGQGMGPQGMSSPGGMGRGMQPQGMGPQGMASPGGMGRGMGRGVPPQGMSPGGMGRGMPPGGRGFGADPNQLDQLLGSLSNQMNNIKDIEASKGVCYFCQKYIYAECMQAMGRTYHPDHFVCNSCQQPLGTSSFYETNGEPTCEKCYQNMFCPRCAYCNQSIADRCVNALNQKWHVNCFVCNSCCQPFASGSFFEKAGMPYCQNCFQGTFSSTCAGCGNNASGQIINALGAKWHPQCFCCTYCRRPFNGLPYFEKDGKPYCEQHYHSSAGSICGGCKTAIVGRCVDALGKKWHPEHFVCSYCMNPLSGGGYTEQHGSPYCQECYANLF